MQQVPYERIEYLLEAILPPNRDPCKKILEDNRKLFQAVQGSGHNHQNWPGGYYDHVQEAMNIGVLLYGSLGSHRRLQFSLSDALLVLFLHDLEKPWKYRFDENGKLEYVPELQSKEAQQKFRMEKLKEYGIVLTSEHENALKYAEGELNDYSKERRVMGQLAAFVHMCDVASARLWYGYPLFRESDYWEGAQRFRD